MSSPRNASLADRLIAAHRNSSIAADAAAPVDFAAAMVDQASAFRRTSRHRGAGEPALQCRCSNRHIGRNFFQLWLVRNDLVPDDHDIAHCFGRD